MLKYHVAVCDDEKSDFDGIVQSVQQYDVQGCFDIETYMDGNELLSELQMQKKSFDLLLLVIEMPSNGFQLAQSLIQMEKHPLVVFVTRTTSFAKPLDFAEIYDTVKQKSEDKVAQLQCGNARCLKNESAYRTSPHKQRLKQQAERSQQMI